MTHFIEGLDRQQTMLLPEHLDDYVDENSHVRAIDAFADMLDLAMLGFSAQAAATGRPGYHPRFARNWRSTSSDQSPHLPMPCHGMGSMASLRSDSRCTE